MLSKVKRRINITDDEQDELLLDIIEQNENYVKLYLGVKTIDDTRLDSVILGMTIDTWNKLGEEGKISSIYSDYRNDFPKQIISQYLYILDAIKKESLGLIRFF